MPMSLRTRLGLKTGIYAIINCVNGKLYVGSARGSLSRRWSVHRCLLRMGKHDNHYLQAAWNKYGENAFEWRVLWNCLPTECLDWKQWWIDRLQAADRKHGYNLSPAAGSSLGIKRSDETKERMRISMLGHKHSEEAKSKMSKAALGRKHTEERKKKIGKASLGRKHSEEARMKISASRKGMVFSEEHRRKLSEAARNRVRTRL